MSPKDEDGVQVSGTNIAADAEAFSQDLTEMDYDKLTRVLELARDSILAADCCIALLGSDRLTKQVSLCVTLTFLDRLIIT
jgi:cohesin loading factor subunit SCC2